MSDEHPRKQRQLRLDNMQSDSEDQMNDFPDDHIGLDDLLIYGQGRNAGRRKKVDTPIDGIVPFFEVDFSSNRK